MPPVHSHLPQDAPLHTTLMPGFRPHSTFDQGTDPFPEIEQNFRQQRAATLPPRQPEPKDEEAPSILLDDNAPIPRLPGEDRPESGTGLFLLDSVQLNGKWFYFQDDCEIEMEEIMSHCIERSFVRGLPAASFKFEGNPCKVNFREMSFTVAGDNTQSVYPASRHPLAKEKVLWQADDQIMRPFIPDAESLILSHLNAEVVFQMDNDLLNVNFEKGIVVDVNTGTQRLIQVVEE